LRFSLLFSSLLLGKSFEEEESFFIHSLVGLYDGGSIIRCAHTREHHAVREREREEEGEEEREGEEKKRNETDRKREREREESHFLKKKKEK